MASIIGNTVGAGNNLGGFRFKVHHVDGSWRRGLSSMPPYLGLVNPVGCMGLDFHSPKAIPQGGVTPIDSILPPATGSRILTANFGL